MKVYLSGPMSGRAAFNRPAFHDAADDLRAFDVTVINPAELPPEMAWIEYVILGLEALQDASLVVVLSGWESSTGAQIEVKAARKMGLPVVELDDFIRILAATYDFAPAPSE